MFLLEGHFLFSFYLKRVLCKDFLSGGSFLNSFYLKRLFFFKDLLFRGLMLFFPDVPFNSFIFNPKSQQTVGTNVDFLCFFYHPDFLVRSEGKCLICICCELFFIRRCSFLKNKRRPVR